MNDKSHALSEALIRATALSKALKARYSQSRAGGWDQESVKAAIASQRRGEFSQICQLADDMASDAAYSGPLQKRLNSLIRSEITFNAYDEDHASQEEKDEYQLIRNTVEKLFRLQVKQSTISNFLRSYLEVGIGLAWVSWSEHDGVIYPEVEALPVEFLRYEPYSQKWKYQTQTGEVIVTPNDGNWIMLSKWQLGRAEGFAAQLGLNWIIRQYTINDWIYGNQIQNELVTIIGESSDAASLDEETRSEFVQRLQLEQSNRIIYKPSGFDLEFQPANPNYRPEAYADIDSQAIRMYQVTILGGNLSTEVTNTGGNRAASQTHYSVEKELSQSDGYALAECLNEQLLPYIALFNLGPEAAEIAPSMQWNVRPGESLTDTISALQAFASLSNMPIKGYRIGNLPEIAQRLGIDLIEDDE